MSQIKSVVGERVSFTYPGLSRPLLEDASFQLQLSGPVLSRVGLIGPNGHGKTTLLKLIRNELTPDTGFIHNTPSSPVIAYLPQTLVQESKNKTLVEFVTEPVQIILEQEQQLHQWEAEMASSEGEALEKLLERYGELQHQFDTAQGYTLSHRISCVMDALELNTIEKERPLSTLSVGQQSRASLARLLLSPADLLVLDEPTNHLDMKASQWLESYLDELEIAILVVSHDRRFLDKTITEIWQLSYGELETYAGNYSDYKSFCEQRTARMRHEYAVQQREIRRLEKSAKQRQGWSDQKEKSKFGHGPVDRGHIGAMAARQAKRSKHMQHRIEQELEQRRKELPLIDKDINLTFPIHQRSPRTMVTLHNIAHQRGGKELFANLQMDIKVGDRWVITGPNGSGKSTLLELLTGKLSPDTGTRKKQPRVELHHYTQEHAEFLCSEFGVGTSIVDAVGVTLANTQARTLLAYLGFKKNDVLRDIHTLSPGQLARVALARALLSGANLLVLDEPTNHLDLRARKALEQGLQQYQGTLVCVTHDRYFLEQLGNNVQRIEL